MIPRATYRLQLREEFGFSDAERIVPYCAALGISHLYLSPILAARAGSTHGYDGIDFTRVDPRLGGEQDLRRLVEACRRHGLGLIVDIVPNHMAVGGADNPYWLDVLENGRESVHAGLFDVDWETRDPALRGKIAAPFLGLPYGEALAAGDIRIVWDPALKRLCAAYYHHRLPLRPQDYGRVLRAGPDALHELAARFPEDARGPDFAEACAALGAQAGETLETALESWHAPERLDALLGEQNFRLAWWRTAGDEINFRRFFEITELAGLRVEVEEVFEAVHATLFRLFAEGMIDGMRVDHVDGLADPAGYCRRLRARLDELSAKRPKGSESGPHYLVVEKILAEDEDLPADWLVEGTTGYDFLAQVDALLHDPDGEETFTELWAEISGRYPDFASEELDARNEMLVRAFAGQLDACAHAFHDLARLRIETRDVTYHAIRRALTQIIAAFPSYRTYATAGAAPGSDAPILARAVEAAKEMAAPGEAAVVDLLSGWISGVGAADQGMRARAVTAFQQLCAPVAAKAVEDTAFYRYGRLLSRNDVGSDPGRFALPREGFHASCLARAATHPHAMLATATHDHKRGEDSRARLAVASALPSLWAERVATFLDLNKRHADAGIDPADEYMLYQALVGAWPLDLDPDDADGLAHLAARLGRFQEKALREAKLRSSWTAPDGDSETICRNFLETVLDPRRSPAFLEAAHGLVEEIASAGAANGLAQTLLRCALPGVPDCYQGREFWDFSLVDPDNRDPVDYAVREAALAEDAPMTDLAQDWRDGRVKARVLARALEARRRVPDLFADGDYMPLEVRGPRAAHVVAFARRHSSSALLGLAGRLLAGPLAGTNAITPPAEWWGDTRVLLPPDLLDAELADALGAGGGVRMERELPVAPLLDVLPVALLVQTEAAITSA